MTGYIKKVIFKYKHKAPTKPQHYPYRTPPNKYDIGAQDPIHEDD